MSEKYTQKEFNNQMNVNSQVKEFLQNLFTQTSHTEDDFAKYLHVSSQDISNAFNADNNTLITVDMYSKLMTIFHGLDLV